MEGHKQIVDAINDLREDMAQRHTENITSHDVTDRKVDEVIRRVDDLHKAFPGGDWDGHRRYHETMIEKAKARGMFYQELTTHLVKGGAWALIVFLAWASWQAIKTKVIH